MSGMDNIVDISGGYHLDISGGYHLENNYARYMKGKTNKVASKKKLIYFQDGSYQTIPLE
jgi:hypothetical protein